MNLTELFRQNMYVLAIPTALLLFSGCLSRHKTTDITTLSGIPKKNNPIRTANILREDKRYHNLAVETRNAFRLYEEERKSEGSSDSTTEKLDTIAQAYSNASNEEVGVTLKKTYKATEETLEKQREKSRQGKKIVREEFGGAALIAVGAGMLAVDLAMITHANNLQKEYLSEVSKYTNATQTYLKQTEESVKEFKTLGTLGSDKTVRVSKKNQSKMKKFLRENYFGMRNIKFIDEKLYVDGHGKFQLDGPHFKVGTEEQLFRSQNIFEPAKPVEPDLKIFDQKFIAAGIAGAGAILAGGLLIKHSEKLIGKERDKYKSLKLAEQCEEQSQAVCRLMDRLNTIGTKFNQGNIQ